MFMTVGKWPICHPGRIPLPGPSPPSFPNLGMMLASVHHNLINFHRTAIKFVVQLLYDNISPHFKRRFEIPIFRHFFGLKKNT